MVFYLTLFLRKQAEENCPLSWLYREVFLVVLQHFTQEAGTWERPL